MLKFYVNPITKRVLSTSSTVPTDMVQIDNFTADLEIVKLDTTWSGTGYGVVEITEVYGNGGLIDKPGSHPLCGVKIMVYQKNLLPFIKVAEFGKIYNKEVKVVKKGSAEISLILVTE